jgi:hypothetical protein
MLLSLLLKLSAEVAREYLILGECGFVLVDRGDQELVVLLKFAYLYGYLLRTLEDAFELSSVKVELPLV